MLPEQVQIESISLTPHAAQAVRELLAKRNLQGYALRVFVSGGGCSGFQYGMALEENPRETDNSYECEGVKLLVDEISIDYLRGATVDYVEDLMGGGFKINNPNTVSSCGCGNSFRTKDEGENSSGGCAGCS